MKKIFNIVSLFSGCGGLDLGFKMAESREYEFKIIWANDILRSPCETYSKNFGLDIYEDHNEFCETPKIFSGDIEKIDFHKTLNEKKVDVVLGGPPCQDFSIIRGSGKIEGKRRGTRVKRGKLFSHFTRALAFLQPKVFVFENVKGLKSANRGKTYEFILEDFEKLKFRYSKIKKMFGKSYENLKSTKKIRQYCIIFAGIVDFSKLGVPQKRERLIIIGLREDIAKSLPLFKGMPLEKIKDRFKEKLDGGGRLISKFPLTSLEVFSGKTLKNLKNVYPRIIQDYENEIRRLKSKKSEKYLNNVWPKYSFDIWKDYIHFNQLQKFAGRPKKEAVDREHSRVLEELGYFGNPVNKMNFVDNSNEIPNENKITKQRMMHIPPNKNHEFVRGTKFEVEGRGLSLIYRRLHPLKPAYTVVAYGGGGTWTYHFEKQRSAITNRERARLQTFPDWFLFKGNRSEIRAQIGEAVPVLASKRIAEVLVNLFGSIKTII